MFGASLPRNGGRGGRRRACLEQGDASEMPSPKLAAMHGDPWREVMALARRIEPNPEALMDWSARTPIWPYGKTAIQLVRDGQADAVLAFLRRVLREVEADAAPSNGTPAMRSLSVW